jgi:hypothetical protein
MNLIISKKLQIMKKINLENHNSNLAIKDFMIS